MNVSIERFALNLLADVAFLLLGLYVFFFNRKQSSAYFKAVVWTSIVFIGTQCFVFPYRTETGLMRVLEAIEGAVVFGLLIALGSTGMWGSELFASFVRLFIENSIKAWYYYINERHF